MQNQGVIFQYVWQADKKYSYLEFKYSLERKVFLAAQLVLVVNDSEY